MYNALLVDDDPASLAGLRNCVDWTSLGIAVCATALNGQAALEECRRSLPHIVVTDIRMPFMDGMELARILRTEFPETKLILISGYSDLDYLKNAVRLGAVDYVLKPIQLDELHKALAKALEELDASKLRKEREERLLVKLAESFPLLREKLLLELLSGIHVSSVAVQERIVWLELDLDPRSAYSVCVVEPDAEQIGDLIAQKELAMASIQNMAARLLAEGPKGMAVRYLRGDIVCVVPAADMEDESGLGIEGFVDALAEGLEIEASVRCRIGVGRQVPDLLRIDQSYESARSALERRFFNPAARVFYADAAADGEDRNLLFRFEDMKNIRYAMEAGNEAALEKAVKDLFGNFAGMDGSTIVFARNMAMQIILNAGGILLNQGIDEIETDDSISSAWRSILKQTSSETMVDRLLELLKRYSRRFDSNRLNRNQLIVSAVRKFVQSRYREPISLRMIADGMKLSASRVGIIFRSETGETINSYITGYRLDKAVELLRSPEYKLYEIGAMVGYSDYKYFSDLFKKRFGKAPSEYRVPVNAPFPAPDPATAEPPEAP